MIRTLVFTSTAMALAADTCTESIRDSVRDRYSTLGCCPDAATPAPPPSSPQMLPTYTAKANFDKTAIPFVAISHVERFRTESMFARPSFPPVADDTHVYFILQRGEDVQYVIENGVAWGEDISDWIAENGLWQDGFGRAMLFKFDRTTGTLVDKKPLHELTGLPESHLGGATTFENSGGDTSRGPLALDGQGGLYIPLNSVRYPCVVKVATSDLSQQWLKCLPMDGAAIPDTGIMHSFAEPTEFPMAYQPRTLTVIPEQSTVLVGFASFAYAASGSDKLYKTFGDHWEDAYGRVVALDTQDGDKRWEVSAGAGPIATHITAADFADAYDKVMVHIPLKDGMMISSDPNDGPDCTGPQTFITNTASPYEAKYFVLPTGPFDSTQTLTSTDGSVTLQGSELVAQGGTGAPVLCSWSKSDIATYPPLTADQKSAMNFAGGGVYREITHHGDYAFVPVGNSHYIPFGYKSQMYEHVYNIPSYRLKAANGDSNARTALWNKFSALYAESNQTANEQLAIAQDYYNTVQAGIDSKAGAHRLEREAGGSYMVIDIKDGSLKGLLPFNHPETQDHATNTLDGSDSMNSFYDTGALNTDATHADIMTVGGKEYLIIMDKSRFKVYDFSKVLTSLDCAAGDLACAQGIVANREKEALVHQMDEYLNFTPLIGYSAYTCDDATKMCYLHFWNYRHFKAVNYNADGSWTAVPIVGGRGTSDLSTKADGSIDLTWGEMMIAIDMQKTIQDGMTRLKWIWHSPDSKIIGWTGIQLQSDVIIVGSQHGLHYVDVATGATLRTQDYPSAVHAGFLAIDNELYAFSGTHKWNKGGASSASGWLTSDAWLNGWGIENVYSDALYVSKSMI